MKHHFLIRYGVTWLAIGAAFLLYYFLDPFVYLGSPLLLFLGAVMVSAWYGGLGPGLMATSQAALLADFFFLPPFHSFSLATNGQYLRLVLFVFEGVLVSLLSDTLLSAKRRAEAGAAALARSEADLRASRDQLDSILGRISEGVVAQDSSGRLIFTNDAAVRLAGFPSAEALMAVPQAELADRYEFCDESGKTIPVELLPHPLALEGLHPPPITFRYRIRATGEGHWVTMRAVPVLDGGRRVQMVINIFHDITERKQAEDQLKARARQQAAIADIRLSALTHADPQALMDKTAGLVAQSLDVELSEVFELLPDGKTLLLRASMGWSEGAVRQGTQGMGLDSQAGYTLRSNEPVIVEDLRAETRFTGQPILMDQGVVSGMSVIIPGPGRPYGVLAAHARHRRTFTQDDIHFLQTFADVLAVVIERDRMEAERLRLFEAEQRMRNRAEEAQQRLAFLAGASTLLATSLDYHVTLAHVAQELVPNLADWCFVDLLDAEGEVHRVKVAHRDPNHAGLAQAVSRHRPGQALESLATRPLLTGRSILIPEVLPQMVEAARRDKDDGDWLTALNPKSLMIVPLVARGQTKGSLTFLSTESGRRYGPSDLALAEELARRAALAIENARLYREAQDAIRQREQFLSMASHELRTPMTVLQGYIESLGIQVDRAVAHADRPPDAPSPTIVLDRLRVTGALQKMARASDRVVELINKLLDVTRLQSGKLAITRERMDLAELMDEVLEDTRHKLAVGRYAHPADVKAQWPRERGVWGRWDKGRIQQVVLNLIDNAIKYSPPSSTVEVCLSVEADPALGTHGKAAHISVRDQGIGIPKDQQGIIFQPFSRAKNAADLQLPGLGLGLAIAKDIVERHQGRIWAESAGANRGSVFHVVLPGVEKG